MSRALMTGQRVRVSQQRKKDCHAGEKGVILRGPIGTAKGKVYSIVVMDAGAPNNAKRIFRADEIEPDV